MFSGREGEKRARLYLEKKGYIIKKINYRKCGIEVDIIALDKDCLVFVEVKSRKTGFFGFPEEFVDKRKQKRLINAARIFSAAPEYREYYIRFDVVTVIWECDPPVIDHLENAFEQC